MLKPCFILLLLTPGVSRADTIGPYSYSILGGYGTTPQDSTATTVLVNQQGSATPLGFTHSESDGTHVLGIAGTSANSFAISALPNSVNASVNGSLQSFRGRDDTGTSLIYEATSGTTSYYAQVVRTQGSTTNLLESVPVIVSGSLQASCSGLQFGSAGLSEGTSSASVSYLGKTQSTQCFLTSDPGLSSFSGIEEFTEGVSERIDLTAQAAIEIDTISNLSANGYAMADPTFQIDPTFADAADFEIVFSNQEISPSTPSAVPEPSSFAMLGTGMLGFAWTSLRRRENSMN